MSAKFYKFKEALKKGSLEESKLYYEEEFLSKFNRSLKNGTKPIPITSRSDYIRILQKLFNNDREKEAEDENGDRAIHHAVVNNHVNILRLVLDSRCDKEATNKNGTRAIHYAAGKGHVDIFKMLLDLNCDIEASDNDENRAIHFASGYGRSETLLLCIEHNCDKEAANKDKIRASHYAAMYGFTDILEILLQRHCDPDPLSKHQETPLDLAKRYNKKKCVQLLNIALKRREDTIKVLNGNQMKKILNILEENSLSIIINTETKTTLLDLLINKNNEDIINEIVKLHVKEKEIKEWRERKNYLTHQSYKLIQECLLYRSIHEDNEAAFEILCTPDIVNNDLLLMKSSVLEIVVEYGRFMFVDKVLTKLLKADKTWTRPMMLGRKKGHHSIVSLISDRQNTLNIEYKGFNRLHIAVIENDLEMVQYILEIKYVNQEAEDKEGRRAIHLAIIGGNVNILRTLIEYQCDLSSLTKDNQTPLDLALTNNNKECIRLIEKSLENGTNTI